MSANVSTVEDVKADTTALKDYFQETFGLPDMQHDWSPII